MSDQQTMLPTQPIIIDGRRHVRFRPNEVIRWLFKRDAIDVHKLFTNLKFPPEDRMQLLQLLGLSLNEYSKSPFITPENLDMINAAIRESMMAEMDDDAEDEDD